MKLQQGGITLEALTRESAELVRVWRNQPEILSQMEFQQLISEEEQLLWFESIQHKSCYYFLILSENQPVGMIHLAKIDLDSKIAEAGLFIGNRSFSGTGVSLGASLLLLDFAFNRLGMQKILAKVKNGNTAAQQYNELLGFIKQNNLVGNFSEYVLLKEVYLKKRDGLIAILPL